MMGDAVQDGTKTPRRIGWPKSSQLSASNSLRELERLIRETTRMINGAVYEEDPFTAHAPTSPPSTLLLDIFMSPGEAAHAALNLDEVFVSWTSRHGERKARLLFHWQAGWIVAGSVWSKILDQVDRVTNIVGKLTGGA